MTREELNRVVSGIRLPPEVRAVVSEAWPGANMIEVSRTAPTRSKGVQRQVVAHVVPEAAGAFFVRDIVRSLVIQVVVHEAEEWMA